MAKEISLREYSQRIEDYLRNARIDEAIAHASQILSAYPKNANAYRNLGRALMRQQRHEEAGEIFRRLLGAIPDDFSAHYQLSIVYEQAKQGDAALFHIERAFDQQPNNKQVNDRLRALYKSFKNTEVDKIQLTAGAVANQYLKAGSFHQAVDLLKRTLEKMPDRTDLRLLLARVYWEAGQGIEAAETCVALLKTSPYVLEANRIMTEFWLEQERPSDAQRFLSRIEELDPYLAFEIATGKAVPDEQFMLNELDFGKYAASMTAQQTPDWLENIEVKDEEVAETPASSWLDKVDASAKPPEAPKKKVTDSLEGLLPDDFDFPESAGSDDSVSNAEEDDLAALLGSSTGLTDLLGTSAGDEALLSGQAKAPRDSTGLTGMLRALGDDEEDDDSWLQELSSGRYDTGELGAKPAESLDDLLADVKDTNEFNPAAEIAHEEDPMSWLSLDDEEEALHTAEDTGSLETPAKAYDPNDPMAWLQSSGIDFDDSAKAVKPSLFEDNEPTALPSKADDPMAWLGGADDDRHLDTNEFSAAAEESRGDDPLAWLGDSELADEPLYDTGDLSTGALASEESDPLAWMSESDEGSDWQSDEDVLAELLDLASLTDEHEAVSEELVSETEAVMSDKNDFTPDDLPEDEDLGLEWLDESAEEDSMAWLGEESDAAPAEEDAMAWMSEAGINLDDEPDLAPMASQEEDPMAWLGASDEKAAPVADEDPMAWLNASQSDELEPMASAEDDFGDLFGEEAPAEDSGFDFAAEEAVSAGEDWLAELENPAEEEVPSGMTGMLARFQGSESSEESSEWLGELDTSDAFEHEDDMSWLNTLDGKETPDAVAPELDAVSEFASDFGDFGSEETPDWGTSEESSADSFDWGTAAAEESSDWGMAAEEEEQALDWGVEATASDAFGDFGDEEAAPAGEDWLADLESPEQPIAMSDDFGDFGDEEAEPAGEMDWMSSLGDEEAEPVMSDDFGDFGDEEAAPAGEDWLADLESPEQPIAMSDDFGDFGDEEAEPAGEIDWMSSLGEEAQPVMSDDFGDFGDEEAEPAGEIDWMSSLGEEAQPAMSDDFGDFGDEEAAPAGEDWLADLESPEQPIAMSDDFGDFDDEEAEPAGEIDWMSSLGDESSDDFGMEEAQPVMSDDFGDFGDEEAEAQELDWMSSLGDEGDDFGAEEAQPAAQGTAWGDLGESGFTDELDAEEAPEAASAWGDLGVSGFTDELSEEPQAAWGDMGDGFTDELSEPEEEAEPAAELDWLSSVSEDQSDDFADEEEEALPQKSTFGMTGMLNSIRATRGEELEETLGSMEEPDWLDHVEGEAEEAVEEPVPSYQPLRSTSIDEINWGDIVSGQEEELEALPFEDSEPILTQESLEAKPLGEILKADEPLIVASTVPSYDDNGDDESHNAPDWLNAMVPGLDLDFEAEEDAALEANYAEREESVRERRLIEKRLLEEAQTGDFAWLQAIVEEESGMMDAFVEEDYIAPAPPPMPQRQQYRFSQLPLWMRESPASAIAMSATEAPDYLNDFEDFDDSGEFDEIADDFEFEDFDDEFDK